jgi:bifunctional enzyme CysN/CysC
MMQVQAWSKKRRKGISNMPDKKVRVTSAGSVDDGKSTVLARLLLDSEAIPLDQVPSKIDPHRLADLLDGLESERQQGITIDVAHRYFDSGNTRFHFADSPGHEQYTRNMATACAGSDALLLILDASVGLKPQSIKHMRIAIQLGVRNLIVAVNKMDLVGYRQRPFDRISIAVGDLLESFTSMFPNVQHSVVPISGLTGANIVNGSKRMEWWTGETLAGLLNNVKGSSEHPGYSGVKVQYVQRVAGGGRRYLGTVISGMVAEGDPLFLGERKLTVDDLYVAGEPADQAKQGETVSFVTQEELDLDSGLCIFSEPRVETHAFDGNLVWLDDESGAKGQSFLLRSHAGESRATLTRISNPSLATEGRAGETTKILANEILSAQISLDNPLPLEKFSDNDELGKFILINPLNFRTVAVGTLNHPLRRGSNITRPSLSVSAANHAELLNTDPKVIWLTGLSGSGKSTIADEISKSLHRKKVPHFVLDGDALRFGLNRDLGFTPEHRTENIRRTAEVAKILTEAGLHTIVCLVSPSDKDRKHAKQIIGDERFHLVYVSTDINTCRARDPKGLYAKADKGEIPNFTGVSAPFEEPIDASFVTTDEAPDILGQRIIDAFLD